jgi:hypothetical protein
MPETAIAFNGAFPIVPYPDPRAAIGWLERAFGGVATEIHPPDPDEPLVHVYAEGETEELTGELAGEVAGFVEVIVQGEGVEQRTLEQASS